MHRAAYRNFSQPTAHESIVLSHTVGVGNSPNIRTGIRWYEIRDPNGSPLIYQQGTFPPPTDNNFRWMPSIAMDKMGNMAVGYSVSGNSLFPSIRFTGRTPTMTPNQLARENILVSGYGVEVEDPACNAIGDCGRWGDFSSMSIDPVDDCTFWYAQEYIAVPKPKEFSSRDWSTQLASFKLTGCY
jgi:hypothetical protein